MPWHIRAFTQFGLKDNIMTVKDLVLRLAAYEDDTEVVAIATDSSMGEIEGVEYFQSEKALVILTNINTG